MLELQDAPKELKNYADSTLEAGIKHLLRILCKENTKQPKHLDDSQESSRDYDLKAVDFDASKLETRALNFKKFRALTTKTVTHFA